MDEQRFDGIARRLGGVTDRRTGLRGLAAVLGGTAVGRALGSPEPAAAKKKRWLPGTYYDYLRKFPEDTPMGIAWQESTGLQIIAIAGSNRIMTNKENISAWYDGPDGGRPFGVALVGSDIYVTDTNLQLVYTLDGSTGDIKNANLVSTGTNGDVYIASSGSGGFYLSKAAIRTLSKHRADGTQEWSVTTCEQPRGVTVGPDGYVYVACHQTGGFQVFDPSTQSVVFTFMSTTDEGATKQNSLPNTLAVVFNGNRGYASTYDDVKGVGRVWAFTLELTPTTYRYTFLGALKPYAKKRDLTAGLTVDTSGNLYLTKPNLGTVLKWTPKKP